MVQSRPARIVWHKVGREHGGPCGYPADLRLNSPEVIASYLSEKLAGESPNRCHWHDDHTIVELPSAGSDENWIIVYFLDRNLQFSMGYKSHSWWLADITTYCKTDEDAVIVRDIFLDVEIDEGLAYRVLDGDEFALAIREGILGVEEAAFAAQALASLIADIESNHFPDPRLSDVYRQYCPEAG